MATSNTKSDGRRRVLFYLPKRSRNAVSELQQHVTQFDVFFHNIRSFAFPRWAALRDLSSTQISEVSSWHVKRRFQRNPWMARNPIAFVYKKLLPLSVRWSYAKAVRAMLQSGCSDVVFNNGNRLPESAVTLAARRLSVRCYFQESGLIPGTLQLDPVGVNAANSLSADPEVYLQWLRRNPDKGVLISDRPVGSYILVPFQVDYDTQIVRHGRWINSMSGLLDVVLNAAEALPGIEFVIREHPLSAVRLEGTVSNLPANVRFSSVGSLSDAIAEALAVVTVNSTVGMESILAGQRLIVLGEACYDLPGLVISAPDRKSLIDSLAVAAGFEPNAELRSAFIGYLQHQYLIRKQPWSAYATDHERALSRAPDGSYGEL